jgi:hypothetical protein
VYVIDGYRIISPTWLMAQADVTSRTSQQTLDLASAAGVCSCTVASAPSATNDTWPWR